MILKNINPKIESSFSFSNRLYRFFWNIIQNSLFKYSPRPFFNFRNFLLKLFGAKIGNNTHIYNGVKIWSPANLNIGNNVGIDNEVYLYSMDKIMISDGVDISYGSSLFTGSHDYNDKNFQLITKSIILKKNIWICAESFIHPGVQINEGCVIGARSVVTKSIGDEYAVFAGNPAKFIKKRNKQLENDI
jgi:putative colanic acid biosynthesis acetyltransferase WcaF